MKASEFTQQLDEQRIVTAIRELEAKTSAEVRVLIFNPPSEDPMKDAQKEFLRLKMDRTQLRTGVLLFIAPLTQQFAIFGDQGINGKCPPDYWQQAADGLASAFRESRFTEGIVEVLRKLGGLLAEHFPRKPDDTNELPDKIETSPGQSFS